MSAIRTLTVCVLCSLSAGITVLSFKINVEKLYTEVDGNFKGEINAYLKIANNTSLDTDVTVLEIIWKQFGDFNETIINIWANDPQKHISAPIKTIVPRNESGLELLPIPKDFLVTFPRVLDDLQMNDGDAHRCFKYWVGVVVKDLLVKSSCLEIRPSWMSQNMDIIADKKVSELAIPGLNSDVSLSVVSGRLSSWPQLMMGFRHLELNVKHELIGEKDILILERNNVTTPLEIYLKEIMEFLRQSKEFVFIQVNLLPYSSFFDGNVFHLIQMVIYDTCKTQLIPRKHSSSWTIKTAWKHDRRLIFYWYLPFEIKSLLVWDSLIKIDYSYLISKELDFEVFLLTKKYHSQMMPYQIKDDAISNESCQKYGSFVKDHLWVEVNFITVSCGFMSDIVADSIEINSRKKDGTLVKQSRTSLESLNLNVTRKSNTEREIYRSSDSSANVWMTLRAVGKDNIYRAIQINWRAAVIKESNSIALFDEDPVGRTLALPNYIQLIYSFAETLNAAENRLNTSFGFLGTTSRNTNNYLAPVFIGRPYASLGLVTTNVTMSRPPISKLSTGGCLGFWVAFLDNHTVIYSECLRSNPRWMWDNRDVISNRTLRSLVLPGSHNAGMVSVEDSSNLINAWLVCQDEEVIAQLLYGIRMHDLIH